MWLLFAEAAVAFLILALIVWWTMFSGRGSSNKPPDDEN
jgi:hypothetical protein